jgi:uncharacterized membrane protein YbhN (UPF0104 family)
MSRRHVTWLQLAISALALGGVAWWFSGQEMPSLPSFSEAAGPLAAAVGLYALATLLRGERWHRLLGHGTRVDAYALTTVGYMGNNALPARAGDILKAVLSAGIGTPPAQAKRHAFGTLVAERLLDVIALLGIFAVVVLAGDLPLGLSPVTVAIVAAVAVVAAGVVWLAAPRVRGLLAGLLTPSRQLLSGRGAAMLALSVVLWVTEGAVYAILGHVAGIGLSLSDGLYVMALANVAAMIPAAPGYVGTFDAAVLLGVRLAGAGHASVALPYVVLVRFVLFVPITLAGLALLLMRYGGVRALRSARAPA